jgi:hypothetical protein
MDIICKPLGKAGAYIAGGVTDAHGILRRL